MWVTRNEEKVEMVALLVILVGCNLLLLGVEGNTNTLDRKVLDYLYNSTYDRGHNYANWTGWGNSTSTSDPCTDHWYGITCIEDDSVQYVSEIDLSAHELFGLPEEIIEMKYLKTLVLSRNQISTANFQMGIFAIQTLEHLDISDMQFYLNIALPLKLQLPNLKHFYASNAVLTGVFPQSWETPKLEDLVLNNNDLMGYLPDDLGKSTNLRQLLLQDNLLTRNFPPSYGDLHQLVNLSLVQSSSSQYRGLCSSLPSTWETMFSLERVSLCTFGHLPDYIGESWQELREFTIIGGEYVGNITSSLCNLNKLEYLDFSYCQFTGIIPECIFSIPSLRYLDLSHNSLSGPIPETVGAAQGIEQLSLANNYLNGTLPRSIGKLTNILRLQLQGNSLIGAIPSEFDALRNIDHLVIIDLSYNMISSIESGLEYFFRDIYGIYYDNPFQCPLPSYVYSATCSMCNTGANHNSCKECVSAGCGWCSYGPNCVEGTHQGPVNKYSCPEGYWSFETCRDTE